MKSRKFNTQHTIGNSNGCESRAISESTFPYPFHTIRKGNRSEGGTFIESTIPNISQITIKDNGTLSVGELMRSNVVIESLGVYTR